MQNFEIVKKPAYAIESVDKALQLILLLQERDELRVNEAAARLHVAPSTAHRLLATLMYRGFALQNESRLYTAGPALHGIPRSGRLQEIASAAHPYLEELRAAVGETANLMARFGSSVRFLTSVESAHLLRVGDRTGTVLPARLSSGGKAILATLDDEALRRLYSGQAAQTEGDRLATHEMAALQEELVNVRSQGYALNVGKTEPDIAAIGMAIRGSAEPAWLAISLSAPLSRAESLNTPQTHSALRECSTRIAAALEVEQLSGAR
ncbi:IclR family transcriptional regulator [Sinomonas terrae]|uniref:IclR family transcriptional regulator n=1 Tax=Sinomonas terrae TaxID=2908838 RepID=A0ABS9U0F7_9MICC|nr:IclR family transcriptional regulator [Sinomonas terrae]MCH6470135.1 IclR family transcriptional regulator [Sinomonas terrae]